MQHFYQTSKISGIYNATPLEAFKFKQVPKITLIL